MLAKLDIKNLMARLPNEDEKSVIRLYK